MGGPRAVRAGRRGRSVGADRRARRVRRDRANTTLELSRDDLLDVCQDTLRRARDRRGGGSRDVDRRAPAPRSIGRFPTPPSDLRRLAGTGSMPTRPRSVARLHAIARSPHAPIHTLAYAAAEGVLDTVEPGNCSGAPVTRPTTSCSSSTAGSTGTSTTAAATSRSGPTSRGLLTRWRSSHAGTARHRRHARRRASPRIAALLNVLEDDPERGRRRIDRVRAHHRWHGRGSPSAPSPRQPCRAQRDRYISPGGSRAKSRCSDKLLRRHTGCSALYRLTDDTVHRISEASGGRVGRGAPRRRLRAGRARRRRRTQAPGRPRGPPSERSRARPPRSNACSRRPASSCAT